MSYNVISHEDAIGNFDGNGNLFQGLIILGVTVHGV